MRQYLPVNIGKFSGKLRYLLLLCHLLCYDLIADISY